MGTRGGRGPRKARREAAGSAAEPRRCGSSEELFPRWDGEGARDSAPAPAAIQLLLLLLLPLLPLLLLLLLHQNHFSFSSHPEHFRRCEERDGTGDTEQPVR
ncbi:hypothetical protein fugu_018995 [Takifugu bimaculatus]|uniref:Uncharacterized protein n=1 Tax=Takifugu bimaculatus TaxID=433685 RepID=A0A4Z2BI36_9TELE|nr:hypothetical protein fugu_018995 [Takifugu bimaculatus]